MRMSCNGCRVLRKGCSENCSIRPCLQWIKNPESQANATVFLAKFYGRAGLLNLINAGPEHLRPAIFRSLLYEACGRIVNPIYGSVGLLWSGSWQLCQQAVEAVLKGAPIVQIPSETAASTPVPPLKAYDIRHVAKGAEAAAGGADRATIELHKVNKSRTRFKRSGAASKARLASPSAEQAEPDAVGAENLSWPRCYPVDFQRAGSHDSAASQAEATDPGQAEEAGGGAASAGGAGDGDSRENESMSSEETAEDASHVSQGEPNHSGDDGEVELELTLGFEPVSRTSRTARPAAEGRCDLRVLGSDKFMADLGLQLPVA